ncbi:unnamed protein product [Microthlaspi erraticum]|uniref:Uncharacterized protein n=1 Tax=Microthlaspi erraticum TaxID=1685480 RepID=A0A6D2K4X0_9BRAS|nr:unnamed protein product [Microthlaspi erraticum]
MGHEEQGRTWCMDAAQLDTQRKKEEVILKTSSTTYSTIRSSSSTRPAKLQLDRAEKSTVKPEKCCFPLDFPLTLNLILFADELVFQCRWKYAIWISRLGDITFVLKTGPQPAERTRPDRKGIGFARPSPGPIRPHDRTVRAGRQWTTIDREHHITADPDGRPNPLHGRPDLREQEAHLCSFDYSQPV